MALDAAISADDIREAAEAAEAYIVHTCGPTVRSVEEEIGDDDEEVPPDELDDDTKSLVRLFEGATVVRLAPRPTAEDDDIPFESPAVVSMWARWRADLDASAARLLERRASAAACRIAA
ncbi:hypothetical protein [Neorhizobium sp. P12A]|uniref:hypothetical protein n=1 Tax=Neorhizobium sp. P12A TaxID=2268027 RepID=UPI0011F06D8A|nr:hypothetical protein [Neorhizobium sp. P12A]